MIRRTNTFRRATVSALLAIVAVAAVLLLQPGTASLRADSSQRGKKLDSELRRKRDQGGSSEVRVIVQTTAGNRDKKAGDLKQRGKKVREQYSLIEGFAASVTPADLDALDADPDVEGVSLDAPIDAHQTPTYTDGQVLLSALGVPSPSQWTGHGVVVAVVDSGIEPTNDLPDNRIKAFYNFIGGDPTVPPQPTSPFDDYGHGSHVAGLIGGDGSMSDGRFREWRRKRSSSG